MGACFKILICKNKPNPKGLTMDKDKLNHPLDIQVKYLKMVGPRRAEQLARLKIYSVHDLLYHFPRDYLDRSRTVSPFGMAEGADVTVRGRVLNVSETRPRRNLTITKAALESDRGVFYAVWFNQAYVKKTLRPGTELLISGKIDRAFGAVQVQVQDFEVMDKNEELLHAGRIVPVYSSTAGLNQRMMRNFIHAALEQWGGAYAEFLPQRLLDEEKLPSLPAALEHIHFPTEKDSAERSRKRFVFEEFLLLQLRLLLRRRSINREYKEHRYPDRRELRQKYIGGLKFALTVAQQRVVGEIYDDLDKALPMNRLLQGDVGSGKTVVAVLTLLRAVEGGMQGAFMAPTEVLAEQHHLSLSASLEPLGVKTALLSGGLGAKERRRLLEQIKFGEVSVVVGTQALLQEDVRFKRLAVVVIDEQHRFGVRQRAVLLEKGLRPDVLIMTATPIPRTLSLTVYGDLDMSVIDSMPPGRQPVRTYYVSPDELPRVFGFVSAQVRSGRQAYVVCPLVEESEKMDLQAAEELYRQLVENELRDCRVALLHGRIQGSEKEKVMGEFRAGNIDVLVSTTVIEVGVDVPNAGAIVIIDADRFGLAQLHQLRGRVGRGGGEAHCILAARLRTREAAERIRAMKTSNDGFFLAEKDLQIRGPGDVTGVRQSGMPEFRLADLARDREILIKARHWAEELLGSDPDLAKEENRPLKEYLRRFQQRTENFDHIS